MKDSVRDALEAELMALEVKFTASGVRREDGKTAAEIEREMAALREEEKV